MEELALIEEVEGLEGRLFACVRVRPGTKVRGKLVKKICYPRHHTRIEAEAISRTRPRTLVHKLPPKRKASEYAKCIGRAIKAAKPTSVKEARKEFKKAIPGCKRMAAAMKKEKETKPRKRTKK